MSNEMSFVSLTDALMKSTDSDSHEVIRNINLGTVSNPYLDDIINLYIFPREFVLDITELDIVYNGSIGKKVLILPSHMTNLKKVNVNTSGNSLIIVDDLSMFNQIEISGDFIRHTGIGEVDIFINNSYDFYGLEVLLDAGFKVKAKTNPLTSNGFDSIDFSKGYVQRVYQRLEEFYINPLYRGNYIMSTGE